MQSRDHTLPTQWLCSEVVLLVLLVVLPHGRFALCTGNATHTDEPHAHPIHTKQFRAPEVLLEYGEWNESSDLWCIACVLYYLYTGTLLFNTHDTFAHLAMMEQV